MLQLFSRQNALSAAATWLRGNPRGKQFCQLRLTSWDLCWWTCPDTIVVGTCLLEVRGCFARGEVPWRQQDRFGNAMMLWDDLTMADLIYIAILYPFIMVKLHSYHLICVYLQYWLMYNFSLSVYWLPYPKETVLSWSSQESLAKARCEKTMTFLTKQLRIKPLIFFVLSFNYFSTENDFPFPKVGYVSSLEGILYVSYCIM